jgi:spore maturation protein CgeB
MRILLYGENWEGTHVNCISRVLEENKIQHKIFDFYKILNSQISFDFINKVFRKLLYSQNEGKINSLLIKEIDLFKPNVLLISKGINIYPETLKVFRDKSILIANWNPDDFFNKFNSNKNLLNSLELYDFVFSARKHLFEEYKIKGIKNSIYLDWYYIPWLHKKPNNLLEEKNKITFIGTYSKRREQILDSIKTNYPIEIWGDQWQFSRLRYKNNIFVKSKSLSQKDFPNVMSQSILNLNILTLENRDVTNLKTFEIPASYGLMLTEYTPEMKSILGDNCFYYNPNITNNISDEISKILSNYTIKNLREIRHQSYDSIIKGGHDIGKRVEFLLNSINF